MTETTLTDAVENLNRNKSQSERIAVFLCARSRKHTAGTGQHNAVKYGPCSVHARIAAETSDLIPFANHRLRNEWRVVYGAGHVVAFGEDLAGARALMATEADDNPTLHSRLVLFTADAVLATAWEFA